MTKETIKNAIKTIKNTKASYLRDGLTKRLNILFFNNGNEFIFGIDSMYSLQINSECGNICTKKQVIEKLNEELEYIEE